LGNGLGNGSNPHCSIRGKIRGHNIDQEASAHQLRANNSSLIRMITDHGIIVDKRDRGSRIDTKYRKSPLAPHHRRCHLPPSPPTSRTENLKADKALTSWSVLPYRNLRTCSLPAQLHSGRSPSPTLACEYDGAFARHKRPVSRYGGSAFLHSGRASLHRLVHHKDQFHRL
jgi:hypothetical protein